MFRISCFLQETRRTATPELYFNLEKIFSRGLLSPVHAAYLPALRVIFAILQIFAILPGKCFSHPMISYEKLLSVLVAVPYAIRHR